MIGDAIYDILSNDANLTAIVSDRIYPIIAPLDTPQPFVVFESLTRPEYLLHGLIQDMSTVTVGIIADGYTEANTITSIIRKALEGIKGEFNGESINHSQIDNIKEDFDESAPDTEAFVKAITLTIKHNQK